MRKATTVITALFLSAAAIYLSSCKKTDPQNSTDKNGQIISKVNSWLDARKSPNKPITNENIERLRKALDFSRLRFEELNKNEDFLIIPINKDFKSIMNKEKDPVNNLVLWVSKSGTIRKGNIVQFIPADKQKNTTVPANTFTRIFNGKNLECDGQFVFLTAADWLLYELTYEKGKIHSYGVANLRENNPANARLETCILWYLTITIYYDDGSTEVYEYNLGIECFGENVPEKPEGDEASGGGAADCCFEDSNINYTTSSICDVDGLSCSAEYINPVTGLITKQCTFAWNYNTNSFTAWTWKHKSVEKSDVEKVGSEWKFVLGGTTHQSSSLVGTIPPCVNYTHSVTSAIPFISPDRRQASMQLSYSNSFKITCFPFLPTRSESLSSTAYWPAP